MSHFTLDMYMSVIKYTVVFVRFKVCSTNFLNDLTWINSSLKRIDSFAKALGN